MKGFGPLTMINAARRARPVVEGSSNKGAPWDELRVLFKIFTSKTRDEFTALCNKCNQWPSGWKLTIISGQQMPGRMTVYFHVDHQPTHSAGEMVRATLSLLS